VNRLLHEKIPLAGIARAAAVSKSWLQGHAHAVYEAVSQTGAVLPKPKGPLTVQMDELWSFVDRKGNQQWVWLAMDAETEKLLVATSATVLGSRPLPSGSPSQPSIDNVPRSTRTSRRPTSR